MSKLGKIVLACAGIAIVIGIIGVIGVVIPENERFNPMYYEADPSDYPYINYSNEASAVAKANMQLTNMTFGSIQIISVGDFTTAKFFVDNIMGGAIFWEISDGDITVRLDACNGEIITYSRVTRTNGTPQSQAQILNNANNYANQFKQLPTDRTSPVIDAVVTSKRLTYNSDDNETTVTENGYQIIRFNRTKSNVVVSDHIEMWIMPDGVMSFYYKNWYMNLENFNVVYTLTAQQAGTVATNYIGGNSTVMDCYKLILRPNDFWEDEGDSGNYTWSSPVCAWVVWVKNPADDLCIVHVNASTGAIVGGDYIEEYYLYES